MNALSDCSADPMATCAASRGDSHTAAWIGQGLDATEIGLMSELYWGLPLKSYSRTRAWSEDDFNTRLEGSAIRRIGHERWLRNIAVALGNAATAHAGKHGDPALVAALRSRAAHPSALVREHVLWALGRHGLPA